MQSWVYERTVQIQSVATKGTSVSQTKTTGNPRKQVTAEAQKYAREESKKFYSGMGKSILDAGIAFLRMLDNGRKIRNGTLKEKAEAAQEILEIDIAVINAAIHPEETWEGIKAEVKDGQMWIDLSTVIKDIMKYNNVHKLRGLQHPPADMKRINFKQDYVVIIRKKLFFSATIETEENYLRMYQINNFTNISTSHSVKGSAAQCNIQLKGGERVICVNKFDEKDKNWKSWENLLNGFTNIDNEGETNGEKWRIGSSEWNDPNSSGIDYKNLIESWNYNE